MTLQDEIRAYVNSCHGNAWRKAHPADPDEPALVSAFLSKEMYRGLQKILRGHISPSTKVLVRGIFTHQTPKVLPKGKSESVEIGDLMLVHQHFSTAPGKGITGRAILFQAKKARTSRTGSLAGGTEATQFELYQSWPEFTGAKRLDKQPDAATPFWNFNNPSVSGQPAADGAEYLTVFKGNAYRVKRFIPQWQAPVSNGPDFRFVKKNYPNASTWSAGSCPPPPSAAKAGVSCKTDFSDVLYDILFGLKGRSFQSGSPLPALDHWSLFVNKMLAFSLDREYVYKLANQGIASSVRSRNLSVLADVPALFHAATEEIEEMGEFFRAEIEQMPHTEFEFMEELVRRIRSETEAKGSEEDGAPPVDEPPDGLATAPIGHVPLLLVVTLGPDEFPFSPNEQR